MKVSFKDKHYLFEEPSVQSTGLYTLAFALTSIKIMRVFLG